MDVADNFFLDCTRQARYRPARHPAKNNKSGGIVSTGKEWFLALLAVAGMAMSSASMAQFDGIYFGGGFTRFKATETALDPATQSSFTLGNEDHQGGFNGFLGYAFTFGNLVNIGLEGSYSGQVGKVSVMSLGLTVADGLEEAAAFSILPGFKLGTSALIYGRVGTAQAKLKAQDGSFSQTHKGMLYGLGMKGAVAKNASVLVEYQNYDMKEKDGVKPEATGVLLGVQYSFN
jgi:opacity protein-like surface antigen